MAKKGNKKETKKAKQKALIILIIFFIIGIAGGAGTCYFITKDDVFKLNGPSQIEIIIDEETYIDEGATAIAFGKDISDKIKVEGTVNDKKAGDYVVKYTVNHIRFKRQTLYKKVTVKLKGEI